MKNKYIRKICLTLISLIVIALFKSLIVMANSGGFGSNNSFYPWLRTNYPTYLDESYYANQGIYGGYNEFMNYYYGKSWVPDFSVGSSTTRSMLNQSFWINEGKAAAWYYSPYGVYINALARRLRAVGHTDNTMNGLIESSSINFSKNFANGSKANVFLSRGTLLPFYNESTGATTYDINPLPDAKTGIAYINQSGGSFNINNSALLINSTATITTNIDNEIKRLGGRNLFVFGGTGVLDMNYAIGSNYNLTRCGGYDRYETLKYWQWFYGSGYNPDINRQQLESKYANGGTGTGVQQSLITIANTMNFGDACTYILNNSTTIGSESNIQTRTPAFVYRRGTGYLIVYYKTGIKGVWQTVGENYRNPNDKPNLLFDSLGFYDDNNVSQTTLYVGQHYHIRTHMINNGYVSTGSNSGIFGLWDVTHSWKNYRWETAPALSSGGGWWTDTDYTPTALVIGNNIQFSVSADNQNNISESNESDNWMSKTVNIVAPIPHTGSLSVTKYDYKESNNVYWVKPNSIFGIYTDGYFPSTYGMYPTRTYVLFAKDGTFNSSTSARQYSYLTGKAKYGSEYDTNFNWDSTNTDLAQQFVLNGNNYLKATHHLSAKYDNTAYKLYHTTSYINSTEFYNPFVDSGIWLKVDGTAPGFLDSSNTVIDSNVQISVNLDTVNLNLNASVNNLYDNGSGIASVYANIYPGSNKALLKKYNFTNVNGSWTLNLSDLYSIFNSDTVTVDIYTVDNVGNVGLIKSQVFDLLTVRAYIVPYDDPSFDGVPTLMKGQKAILRIYTTGGANKIKIEFPLALYNLNNALNDVLNITPASCSYGEYIFNVPLNAADDSYQVTVTAIKDITNSQRSCYPQFLVQDSILNGIKTRRRE